MVQNSLCEKLVLSHMPDQFVQYEMKKHSAAHLIPFSLKSIQIEMVSLSLKSIHMKTKLCLLPTASMKPHLLVDQLVEAHELVIFVLLVEVHQDLQPEP